MRRIAPCPCGSGKRFKHCHGFLGPNSAIASNPPSNVKERLAARELQRRQQQGLGRPIVSAVEGGVRYILVADKVWHSSRWLTFPDFLVTYLTATIGRDWLKEEHARVPAERHPLTDWLDRLSEHYNQIPVDPEQSVKGDRPTGAVSTVLHLAYDLYCLAHNLELQEKLVARLRDSRQFRGARYETFVAASLIRAGFTVEFENEDDRKQTHCEFTARSRGGKAYSVEAKCRQPESDSAPLRLGRQLNRALRKTAAYQRIVFIELNRPDLKDDEQGIAGIKGALLSLRAFEAAPLPPAYIVLTNMPHEHLLDHKQVCIAVAVDGFKIPQFHFDAVFESFRAAHNAREAHRDIHDLAASLNRDRSIPTTFDGDNPALAFGQHEGRLQIGDTYLVPSATGSDMPGRLVDAIVVPAERCAYCVHQMPDGSTDLHKVPLSDAELEAYERHPETFFGVIRQVNALAQTDMELFDFFLRSARRTARERLIAELTADPKVLQDSSHEDLALLHAERTTINALKLGSAKS